LKESLSGRECNRAQVVGIEPQQRAHERFCITQRANIRDEMISMSFRQFDVPLLSWTCNRVFSFELDCSMGARQAENNGDLLTGLDSIEQIARALLCKQYRDVSSIR